MKPVVNILFWITMFIMLLGMYKPWIVLWWLAEKNRKMVLQYYGITAVILFLILMFL